MKENPTYEEFLEWIGETTFSEEELAEIYQEWSRQNFRPLEDILDEHFHRER